MYRKTHKNIQKTRKEKCVSNKSEENEDLSRIFKQKSNAPLSKTHGIFFCVAVSTTVPEQTSLVIRDLMCNTFLNKHATHTHTHFLHIHHQLFFYEAIVLELLIPESHLGNINVYVLLEELLLCIIFPKISLASLY